MGVGTIWLIVFEVVPAAELENRLDFTERLLAQKEPETLAKPRVT